MVVALALLVHPVHAEEPPWEHVELGPTDPTVPAGPVEPAVPVEAVVPEAPEPVVPRSSARAVPDGEAALYLLSAAYGAYVGGNIAYLVDEAAEEREEPLDGAAITIGGALGAGAGVGTAALLAARLDPTPAEVAGLGTGMLVGGFVGHNIGSTFIAPGADGRTERVQAAQLAGTMGGIGLAIVRGPHVRTVGSNLHLDVATLAGWQTAAGISDLAGLDPARDVQLRSGLALAGGLGFLGTAAVLGPRLETPTANATWLALGDAAWLGAWTPYLFADEPTEAQLTGGLRLGIGAGYLGTVALAALGQPSSRSVGLQAIGASAGSALGAGVPLALGGEGPARAVVGPMLAVGAGGQLAGALVAPHYEVSDDDRYLLGTLAAWTGYQTAGWSVYASAVGPDAGTRPAGYALTAGGAGTLLTMASAPLLDVRPATSFQLLASGGWGTWFGGFASELADLEKDEQWLVTLAAGDAAIVGTAVAAAAGFDPTWSDIGITNGVGAMGAAAGGLLGVVFLYEEDDLDPLVLSTLGGSAVGLALGGVLAARSDGGAHDLALPAFWRMGLDPSFAVRPWTDDEDRPGVWVELRVDEIAKP